MRNEVVFLIVVIVFSILIKSCSVNSQIRDIEITKDNLHTQKVKFLPTVQIRTIDSIDNQMEQKYS
jgi:hypothetical protein